MLLWVWALKHFTTSSSTMDTINCSNKSTTQQDNERLQVTRHSPHHKNPGFNHKHRQTLSDSWPFVQKLYLNGCPYLEVQLLNRRASSGTRADESQVYAIYKVTFPLNKLIFKLTIFWEGGGWPVASNFPGVKTGVSPFQPLGNQSVSTVEDTKWVEQTDTVLSLYELS